MKKENLIAQLEGAKALTSVVSIDNVIALIQQLEPEIVTETKLGMSQELAEEILEKIERTLDYNSREFADTSSAEFELNYDNRIELVAVDVDIYEISRHVSAVLDSFVVEEDEASDGMEEVEEGILTDVVELERGDNPHDTAYEATLAE